MQCFLSENREKDKKYHKWYGLNFDSSCIHTQAVVELYPSSNLEGGPDSCVVYLWSSSLQKEIPILLAEIYQRPAFLPPLTFHHPTSPLKNWKKIDVGTPKQPIWIKFSWTQNMHAKTREGERWQGFLALMNGSICSIIWITLMCTCCTAQQVHNYLSLFSKMPNTF